MTSLKRDEISGVMIDEKWMPRQEGQRDIQAVEEGIIVQESTGTRILYPWARVDHVTLLPR